MRAFIVAIAIILLFSIGYIFLTNKQPLEPTGSLANVDITTTPEAIGLSPTPQGNAALSKNKTSGQKFTYTLLEKNNSGITGKVDMREENEKIVVTITLEDEIIKNYSTSFHTGTCESPGEIVYPLTNVQKSFSQTILDESFENFKQKFPLIVIINSLEKGRNTYVACGEIIKNEKEELEQGKI